MRLAQRQQQRALSFAEALLFRNNRYHALTSNGNARRQAALCERPLQRQLLLIPLHQPCQRLRRIVQRLRIYVCSSQQFFQRGAIIFAF